VNSPTSWTIRAAFEDDLDAIRALYADVWGYSRPQSFDRWRYVSPPQGFCPIAIAVDDDRVVGAYTIWPVKIRVGNQVLLGAQSMDTMTHPDYQGQGVFTKLAEACYDIAAERGFKVLYGFPNPLSYPGFVKKLEWTHTGEIPHWVRILKPSGHPKIPSALGPIVDGLAALLPKGRTSGLDIKRVKPDSAALNALLGHWQKGEGVCKVERTAEWLGWRYALDTENDYRWVSAYRGANLVAAGVWGKRNQAWGNVADNRAHLVDLLGGDAKGLAAILAAIIKDAATENSIVLETLCNFDRLAPALRRAGFYRHRQAPLIVKILTDEAFGVDILAHENWRIMGSDVDTL
jgi:GNAT superfamily N-acetyltransferase